MPESPSTIINRLSRTIKALRGVLDKADLAVDMETSEDDHDFRVKQYLDARAALGADDE